MTEPKQTAGQPDSIAKGEESEIGAPPVRTLWLTGLPCSGKTTTALALAKALKARKIPVEVLDGDELRRHIGGGLGFSREDRMENVRRAVYLAGMLNRHGVTVIVSLISPYADMRQYARAALPNFMEVYVECPLEQCERRDVKGLYAKARRGEVAAFTGVSDPYEIPTAPELTIRTDTTSPEENVLQLLQLLQGSGQPASVSRSG